MSSDSETTLRARISGLERELTRINVATSAAISERKRMEQWFSRERPGMIGCSPTILELVQAEQRALDEFAFCQRQLFNARRELDAYYEPSVL